MQLFSSPDRPNRRRSPPLSIASAAPRRSRPWRAGQRVSSRPSHQERRRFASLDPGLCARRAVFAQAGRGSRGQRVVDVSDVALLMRFRRCGDWLIALCEICWRAAMRRRAGGRTKWGPPHRRLAYRGTRQNLLSAASVLRCRRPADRRFRHYPARQRRNAGRVGVQPGDIAIADRGYPQPDGMRATRDARRSARSTDVEQPQPARRRGEPVDWLALFAKADAAGHFDMPVTVHKARGRFKPLPMRLVITPKPPDIAERARDVARHNARKDLHDVDPRTLRAAGYMILITSLDATAFPPHCSSASIAFAGNRLAFKRLNRSCASTVARQSRARPSLDRRPPPSRAPDRGHNGPMADFSPSNPAPAPASRPPRAKRPPRALATHLPPGGCPEAIIWPAATLAQSRNVRPKMSTAVRTTRRRLCNQFLYHLNLAYMGLVPAIHVVRLPANPGPSTPEMTHLAGAPISILHRAKSKLWAPFSATPRACRSRGSSAGGARGQPRARLPHLVGSRLPSPYHFPARI